jgi:transcriptional regulator with PAS, ATPase and Fis domain
MAINCTSLPEPLVESELLGHERGAFTDAKQRKKGLFELADGGTVLLDEIGDMPLGTQAKVLRLLDTKTFKRVGGTSDMRVDVRVIAVTHRDLRQAVQKGTFREDLFYRLDIVSIYVPALADRIEDLPYLCAHFIRRFNDEFSRDLREVTPEALALMSRYRWPGNVRELRNVIERAYILEAPHCIDVEHLPLEIRDLEGHFTGDAAGGDELDLNKVQVKMIQNALEQTSGNQTHAAKLLGISRDTLRYRLKKHGLK